MTLSVHGFKLGQNSIFSENTQLKIEHQSNTDNGRRAPKVPFNFLFKIEMEKDIFAYFNFNSKLKIEKRYFFFNFQFSIFI